MNKSMMIGALFGAAVATAGGGLAGYHMLKEPEVSATEQAGSVATNPDRGAAENGTAAAGDATALASHDHATIAAKFAEVLAATPVTEQVKTPRQECHDEVVTRQKPVKDTHQVTGTLIGAVAGGLLGNELGGHGSNTGAKILGAAAGGYAGNKAQEKIQDNATYQTTERVCHTVTDISERTVGYNVTYRLDGETGRIHMDYDPGAAIPVQDGKLVLSRRDEP